VSIKVMTSVWARSEQKGSALLLLLAIADHAHDDGAGAYPSAQTLAKKIRMGVRQTRALIGKLERSGELRIERGAGPHATNVYTVQPPAGVQTLHGLQQSAAPPAKSGRRGVQPASPKPSVEPSLSRQSARARGTTTTLQKNGAANGAVVGRALEELRRLDYPFLEKRDRRALEDLHERRPQVDLVAEIRSWDTSPNGRVGADHKPRALIGWLELAEDQETPQLVPLRAVAPSRQSPVDRCLCGHSVKMHRVAWGSHTYTGCGVRFAGGRRCSCDEFTVRLEVRA
jgi:hypothetical protein